MSADTRKQKRALRKQYRKERKEAFEKLIVALNAFMDIDLKEKLPYKDKFKQVWPAVKPTLEFAITLNITGEKFDTPAKQLVLFGDSLFRKAVTDQEAMDFLSDLSEIWDMIEKVLDVLKIVVPDKVDAVIDKIIEIGEWLFE
jgi:hypothetical protein